MAVLHQQFCEFNNTIKLTPKRKESLKASRKALRRKIREWFRENKPNEIQPKFWGQGSFEMNTTINPIPKADDQGNNLLHYDLDYGVYFIEKEGENNKRAIDLWHDWVYAAVEDHTNTPPKRKTTCVRVLFADGHHIDLPIYYKEGHKIELAHRSKNWIASDPKAFFTWFNEKTDQNLQLEKIVRYLKAWKNYRENCNSNLKFPSGFELTILATNNLVTDDNDDDAFRKTINKIYKTLNLSNGFQCLRPTTPVGEDVFSSYSIQRKNDFLVNLADLVQACNNAQSEKNRKKASEVLRKEFGDRFPVGPDIDDDVKSAYLAGSLASTPIHPKPFIRK